MNDGEIELVSVNVGEMELEALNRQLTDLKSFPPENNLEAIELIQKCVKLNVVIPEQLNSWVGKACESWIADKGYAVTTLQTANRKEQMVIHIKLYIYSGMKPGKAIAAAAEHYEIDRDSISTYYYSKEGKRYQGKWDEIFAQYN